MDNIRSPNMRDIIFIVPQGSVEIRMVDTGARTIAMAAEALEARYIVMIDHVVMTDRIATDSTVPVWGVYDTRHIRKNEPFPGESTLPLPRKTFESPTADGAVMWALAQGSA